MVMKDIMIRTIENLKEKVRNNLFDIQNNQKSIRHWLKQPASEQRSAELEEKYALNKVLLNENNDFINVQLTLTSFIEKYKDSDLFENNGIKLPVQYKNENECFEMTVNGFISFDSDHPYYESDSFYQRLLDYFQAIEDYENCSKLVLAKSQS